MAEANAKEALDSFFEDWVSDVDYNVLGAAPYIEEPVETPAPEPVRRERPERKVRIRPLPSQNPAPRKTRDRSKVLFLFSAAILLIGTLSIAATYSDVYSRKAMVSELKSEIEETRLNTAGQVVRENTVQDTGELYAYAIHELGMKEADESNTVFLTLPRQSYTEMPAAAQEQTTKVTFHWFS